MNKRKIILALNALIYTTIIAFIVYAKILGDNNVEDFHHLIREDGWVEYLTVLFLLAGAVGLIVYAVNAAKRGKMKKVMLYSLACLFFIFVAGEEISWGQRIFSVETTGYFMENNYQGETNLHNLEIAGVDLNKLIFSKMLFVALLLYFVVLPLLVWKVKAFKKLVDNFGIILPRLHHTLILFAINVFIPLAIGIKRESELHELALTGIVFLILIHPAKRIRDVKLEQH